MPKRDLEPLIPLEQLKETVQALLRVPKDELDKAEAERPKRRRSGDDSVANSERARPPS